MKTNKFKLFVLVLLTLVLATSVFAECTTTDTSTTGNYQLNQSTMDVYTLLRDNTANDKFKSISSITPAAIFNHVSYESLDGKLNGTEYTLQWYFHNDTYAAVNSSFVLYNSTENSTNIIARGNYTIVSSNNKTFRINFSNSNYNGTELLAKFNRTYMPTLDDIYKNSTGISTLFNYGTWLVNNSQTDYGQDFGMAANWATYAGESIDGSTWKISYTYTTKDCSALCDKPVNVTLLNIVTTFFLIGMLVFLGFSVYNGASGKTIVALVVAFLIMLVAMAIIKQVVGGVCVV